MFGLVWFMIIRGFCLVTVESLRVLVLILDNHSGHGHKAGFVGAFYSVKLCQLPVCVCVSAVD